MKPQIVQSAPRNSLAYETQALIRINGFREYDARWLYGNEINPLGLQILGMGLGTMITAERGSGAPIIVGHDYRAYSTAVKQALILGLMSSGCAVYDIGLAMTPIAYFAQTTIADAAVAMVTASHNENGWTGVKMGMHAPLTFGPTEMTELRRIVLEARFQTRPGGSYQQLPGMAERYGDALIHAFRKEPLRRRLRCVVACGNGTAGAFAPQILEQCGLDVIPLDCDLDHDFPRYNPNPEDMDMLHALAEEVRTYRADIGFAFDGDGDRCGVVDDQGTPVFADRIGLAIARNLAQSYPGSRFVVDVKSTGLFATDPVLAAAGCTTEYGITGHSHIKRHLHQCKGLAAFEKSGHFFFAPPLGEGYDDGLNSALMIARLLDHSDAPLSGIMDALPRSWNSPSMSPHCDDDKKYQLVADARNWLEDLAARGQFFAGRPIRELITVNGVRVVCDNGDWGLIRASSNKPELVIVVESIESEARMRAMFEALDAWVQTRPEIGDYNQKLD